MKFTRDQITSLSIRRIGPGSIKVGDEFLNQSFALIGDEVVRDWQACAIDELCEGDFERLIASEPELILLGTGTKPLFPPRELVFALARRGIGLEAMDTAAACRTFNILINDGRRVAAVFVLQRSETGDGK